MKKHKNRSSEKMTNESKQNHAGVKKKKTGRNIPKTETKGGVKISEYKSMNTYKMKRQINFPGRKAVDPRLLQKYNKGKGVAVKHVGKHNSVVRVKQKRKEEKIKKGEEELARVEVLLTETSGQLEAEEGTYTSHITQRDIRAAVDITSAAKSFDLKLDQFGPYKMRFTRNGRHLVLGGRKGHLASMDWITKKLHFEINAMESIHDVCWLHTEEMVATAQKKWVYIYDNQGTELHCLKTMDRVLHLEFLPYHFLLCASSETGFLSWLDVTLGQEVIQIPTYKGRLEVMCQNPYNAVLCCGHSNGTVTMWTPNSKEPVASVLCHPQALRALDVDPSGRYLATAGSDKVIKIWDARKLGECIQSYKLNCGASNVAFSQKGLLAVSMGNIVEVFRNVASGGLTGAYMRNRGGTAVTGMQFCPYEDILGVASYTGYSSLIIPGAGEPNFDALEANPFISSSGRREAEVKALLSKIPSDLITLDPMSISQVDVPTLREKLEAKNNLLHVRKRKIDVTPRYRMKGKSGSASVFKRKQKMKEDIKREYLKNALQQRDEYLAAEKKTVKELTEEQKPAQILDRFKPKKNP